MKPGMIARSLELTSAVASNTAHRVTQPRVNGLLTFLTRSLASRVRCKIDLLSCCATIV